VDSTVVCDLQLAALLQKLRRSRAKTEQAW